MWQPIDTIPNGDYSKKIDIWDGYKRITDCYWGKDGWYHDVYEVVGYGCASIHVTNPEFWMYVPEPPESSTH